MLSPESFAAAALGLALAAFLAATVLPLASEVAFGFALIAYPSHALALIVIASAANTAGGMTSYAIGRFAAARFGVEQRLSAYPKTHEFAKRHGAMASFFSFVPVLGDVIVLAAGALRVNALGCAAWQAFGRTARYAVLAWPVVKLWST
jgi:membrane protein YqaA with SNARE-associated domain